MPILLTRTVDIVFVCVLALVLRLVVVAVWYSFQCLKGQDKDLMCWKYLELAAFIPRLGARLYWGKFPGGSLMISRWNLCMRLAPLHGFLRLLFWGRGENDPDARRRAYVIHHRAASCPCRLCFHSSECPLIRC